MTAERSIGHGGGGALAGVRAVVTGGSKGIGLGIARVLAGAGARLVITGRDGGALAEAARSLGEVEVHTFADDLASDSAARDLAAFALDRLGGVDVLCANAGIFPSAPLAQMTAADLDRVMRVNLYGTIFTVQAFTPALAESGRGRVVMTSSITGPVTGYPGWAHYAASKAAQLGFMRTAAIELAPRKITVNAVLPGNIATEGLVELGDDYLRGMAAAIPLGRLGSPEDIGHAVAFLASEGAGYITGQSIVVDGGQVLPESAEALAAAVVDGDAGADVVASGADAGASGAASESADEASAA